MHCASTRDGGFHGRQPLHRAKAEETVFQNVLVTVRSTRAWEAVPGKCMMDRQGCIKTTWAGWSASSHLLQVAPSPSPHTLTPEERGPSSSTSQKVHFSGSVPGISLGVFAYPERLQTLMTPNQLHFSPQAGKAKPKGLSPK